MKNINRNSMMALCLGEDTCLCHNHIDGFEFDGSSEFSIEIRFVLKSVTNGHFYSDNSTFDLGISNGNLYFDAGAIGRVVQSLDLRIENEVMYYVAVVYNKQSLTLYLNGVEIGKSELSKTLETAIGDANGKPFKIGDGLNTLIPSLRLVVSSLSVEEIKSDFYNGLSDREDVIFWGDFSDVQYRDKSPNNLPLYAEGGYNANCRNICSCVRFDGNGGFVDSENNYFDAAYSVLCKLYPDYCTTHKMHLFSLVSTSEQKTLFSVVVDSEDSAKYICIQASDKRTDKVFIPDDMWIDVAVTVENSEVKLFVDGEFKTSLNASFAKTQCQLLIGVSPEYRKYGFKDAFVGYLGYTAVFDVALSSDETAIYAENQPYMFEHGLIANYIFTGNDIIDVTTGNRILTLGCSKSVYEPALNPVSAEIGIDLRIPTEICAEWNALSSYEKWQVSTAMDCVRNVYGQCYGIPMDTAIPIEQTALPQIRRRYADILEVMDGYESQDINVVAEEIASLATATAGVGSVAVVSGKASADGTFLSAASTLAALFAAIGVVLMPFLTDTVIESISDDENDKPSNDKASLKVISLCGNHNGDPTLGSIHFHSDVNLEQPKSMVYTSNGSQIEFELYLIAPKLTENQCLCIFTIHNTSDKDFVGDLKFAKSIVFEDNEVKGITIPANSETTVKAYLILKDISDTLNDEIIILQETNIEISANGQYLHTCKGRVFISNVTPVLPWRLFKADDVSSESYDCNFVGYPSLKFVETLLNHSSVSKESNGNFAMSDPQKNAVKNHMDNYFNNVLIYDIVAGASRYTNNYQNFHLKNFLINSFRVDHTDIWIYANGKMIVNCSDCACLLNYIMGIEGVNARMTILTTPSGFRCNQIIPIGFIAQWQYPFYNPVNNNQGFSFHQICVDSQNVVVNNTPIYDLCLKIDSGPFPGLDINNNGTKVPFLSGGYEAQDNNGFLVNIDPNYAYVNQVYRERLVETHQNVFFVNNVWTPIVQGLYDAPLVCEAFENRVKDLIEYFQLEEIECQNVETDISPLLNKFSTYKSSLFNRYLWKKEDVSVVWYKNDKKLSIVRLIAETLANSSCIYSRTESSQLGKYVFESTNSILFIFHGNVVAIQGGTMEQRISFATELCKM